ncbi:sugar porter family MFS transporter [Saccharopolyspora cebuensis]|uniref:Sugar porter family MFS transporter n=1 Tax=Saccharopolyspora cebuensis TaxID=418759 RepID=A0ABV4CM92_9PSEU
MQAFSSEPGTEGPLRAVPGPATRTVWIWASTIAVGGFLFGFDTGVISGALLFIKREFGLTAFEQGSVVSVLLLGAMAGALAAGWLADRLGRRAALGVEGLVFLLGTALAVTATGYWTLVLGRVVLGVAVGAASATVPAYLSEIAPKRIRGRLLTLNQLMITSGILAAYLVNLAFSAGGRWREMIGVGALPALVLLAGAAFWLPETPAWLIARGRVDKARAVLRSIAHPEEVDDLVHRYRSGGRPGPDADPGRSGWRVLLAASVRPALVVGLLLAAVQQFGGINTIIYYAPTVIEGTGISAGNSIFCSVFIGVINLVMTLVAIRFIDTRGRRRLLLVSLAGMTISLVLLGLSFVLVLDPALSLVFMVLYIAAYSAGLGPVFWVLIGEVFPPHARAVGSAASTTVNWLANFVVSLTFLTVVNSVGTGQTFWLFAVVCAFALWFVARYVPETGGREFDEVDTALAERFGRRRPQRTA